MFLKRIIFKQLIYFFSFFIKTQKDKWIISLLKGGGGSSLPENALFFCKHLKQKKIQFKYISNLPIENLEKEHLKPFSLKYFFECIKSGVLIVENDLHNDIPAYRSNQTYKVHLFHGLALKKIYLSSPFTKNIFMRNFKNFLKKILVGFCFTDEYDLIVTSNKIHKTNYIKSFNNKNVEILGQPRNDFLIKCEKKIIKNKLLNKIGFDNFSGKIISYLPTFRDTKFQGNLSILENKKIKDFLIKNNCILLVKDHFFYENNYANNYENEKKSYNNNNLFKLGNRFLTQEILAITDVLITDYSGIYFDYLLMKKPIIYYCYDYDEYVKKNRDIDFDYFDEIITPGPKVKSIEQLIKSLEKNLTNFDYENYINQSLIKFHQYNDGGSCERLYNYITKKLKD